VAHADAVADASGKRQFVALVESEGMLRPFVARVIFQAA